MSAPLEYVAFRIPLVAPWSESSDGTADIRVRTGCTCSARWFACECNDAQELVYTGPGIDQTMAPRPEFVQAAALAHPGAQLVYIHLSHVHGVP